MRKNDEYLVQKAQQLLKADPRTILATVGDTPDSVIEHLEEEGYQIEELDYYLDYYDTAPEMPEAPQAEWYSSEENYAEAMKRYEAALARFTEQTRQLEFDVTEGRVRKYAVIGMFDVEIRYEDVRRRSWRFRSRIPRVKGRFTSRWFPPLRWRGCCGRTTETGSFATSTSPPT